MVPSLPRGLVFPNSNVGSFLISAVAFAFPLASLSNIAEPKGKPKLYRQLHGDGADSSISEPTVTAGTILEQTTAQTPYRWTLSDVFDIHIYMLVAVNHGRTNAFAHQIIGMLGMLETSKQHGSVWRRPRRQRGETRYEHRSTQRNPDTLHRHHD